MISTTRSRRRRSSPKKRKGKKKEIAIIFSGQSNSTGAQYATLQLDEEKSKHAS
jgi:hypothetical protein